MLQIPEQHKTVINKPQSGKFKAIKIPAPK
jgi:hypothetical protein